MNFREFVTKRETLILAGKSAENNEQLIAQVKPSEEVFHTIAAGSPFVNIKGKPKKGDIKEAAIICAAHSQDWRDNKKNVKVHRFKGKDIYKIKLMKLGTFGVKKKKVIIVKKADILGFKK
ncbi:NFACT RNA binding domain-containing protein [Nanoarchaeota archaeon]